MSYINFFINGTEAGKTLEKVLINKYDLSKTVIHNLKKYRTYNINGLFFYLNHIVSEGDQISVYLDFGENSDNILPVYMPLDILYEDDWLIAVNKPVNTPVHPSAGHFADSLANGLMYHMQKIYDNFVIRIITRLDRDTSGVVLFAKNAHAQEVLIRQMKEENKFYKEYTGITEGNLPLCEGFIDLPIRRKEGSIIEREVHPEGQPALTLYKIEERKKNADYVKFVLITGRTHQIRVHVKALGNPLIGDGLYHRKSPLIGRQALHSGKISFFHPYTGKKITIKSPLPDDIIFLWNNLT